MSKTRVLFCDDSGGVVKGFMKNVGKPLEHLIDFRTAASVSGVEAFIADGEAFDVVVTDLNFEKVGGGSKDGLEVIRLAKQHWPEVEPILMTAYVGALDVRDGQRLSSLGVGEDSLLAKTDAEDPGVTWLRLRERIQGIALRFQGDAEQITRLRRENRYLREAVSGDTVDWVASRSVDQAAREIRADENLFLMGQVGKSFQMQEVFGRIRRTSPLPSDVLILGETGTGKELVARALHELSPRSGRPFVTADLTTTSGNLVESELFGHEKGAFTGADAQKAGLLKSAQGGTFFLDEIGNISQEIQAKLLRVLEERRYRPLGSTIDQKADLRFLAATNVDLAAAAEEGRFRADLYERLNAMRIVLPPLALRPEDIPLLVAYFLDEFRTRFGTPGLLRIDAEALRLLADQPWPRNIRQLRHAVERLFSEVDPECPQVSRADVE
ncbi:MAG: sigma-54 dependent transcriptional regulator, partial [Planctomycetota bacterium]